MTTCAAYARPAPKAMNRAVSPLLASPSSISRSSASGIEAAEVLPCSAMSRAILTCVGQLHRPRHRVDDAHVGLVGDEDVEVVDGEAGAVEGLACAILAISKDAQRNTGLPCIIRCGIVGLVHLDARRASPRAAGSGRTARRRSPRRPGRCRARRTGPTTAAPAPSAKMNAVPRSLDVGDVGEPLDADHQDVLRAAAAHHVGGQAPCRGRSRRRRRRCRRPPAGRCRARGRSRSRRPGSGTCG